MNRQYQLIRKSFPKVYRYEKKGQEYFLVDGRSKRWGLNIRKNFTNQSDAIDFARELEKGVKENGNSVVEQVRYQSNQIQKMIDRLGEGSDG